MKSVLPDEPVWVSGRALACIIHCKITIITQLHQNIHLGLNLQNAIFFSRFLLILIKRLSCQQFCHLLSCVSYNTGMRICE